MEKEDIYTYVSPIVVLEHKEIDQDSIKKKEVTQLKIGLKRNEFSDIPTAMKRELPGMRLSKFVDIQKDKHFLSNLIKICEECYFLLNDINNLTQADLNAKIRQTHMHNKILDKMERLERKESRGTEDSNGTENSSTLSKELNRPRKTLITEKINLKHYKILDTVGKGSHTYKEFILKRKEDDNTKSSTSVISVNINPRKSTFKSSFAFTKPKFNAFRHFSFNHSKTSSLPVQLTELETIRPKFTQINTPVSTSFQHILTTQSVSVKKKEQSSKTSSRIQSANTTGFSKMARGHSASHSVRVRSAYRG